MRAALIVILAATLTACGGTPLPSPSVTTGVLEVTAVAGPTCPVETDPPDPNCAPRPVEGARVLVSPGDGRDIVVADGTTDARGQVTFELAPGDYIVTAFEVAGLMGTPEPATVTVAGDEAEPLTFSYDTGIR
jgi:hypothetical protein